MVIMATADLDLVSALTCVCFCFPMCQSQYVFELHVVYLKCFLYFTNCSMQHTSLWEDRYIMETMGANDQSLLIGLAMPYKGAVPLQQKMVFPQNEWAWCAILIFAICIQMGVLVWTNCPYTLVVVGQT
jgi:hypothetical protein